MCYVLINNEVVDRKTNWNSDDLRDCVLNLSKNKNYKSVNQVISVVKDVLTASGNEIKEPDSADFIFLIGGEKILDYLSTLSVIDGFTFVKLELPLSEVPSEVIYRGGYEPGK